MTGARRFDAVIFDLDDTLRVDDNGRAAVLETCAELAAAHPEIDAGALASANAAVWAEFWPTVADDWMVGRIADSRPLSEQAWTRALADLGIHDPAIAAEAVERHILAVTRTMRFMDGAAELLDAVQATGAKLAIITNGAVDVQTDKLRDLGILDRFDVVTTSGGAGIAKPEAAIFELTLDALGVAADRAVHIGDNLMADVGGAKAAGLSAVWINLHGASPSDGYPVPDFEVRSVGEIAALLT